VLGAARIPAEIAPVTVTGRQRPQRTELAPIARTEPVERTEAAAMAPVAAAPTPAADAPGAPPPFPPLSAPSAAGAASEGPAPSARPAKRGGPPIALFIVGAILIAGVVVGAVIALSGGSAKKRKANVAAAHSTIVTSTSATLAPGPDVVAEGDANNLLSQFDAIWDSGATTQAGFAPILSEGVTYTFADPNPANAVTLSGFGNVAAHFKSDLKSAGSSNASFLFNNPTFSEDGGFTIATGTWTSSTLLGSPGTFTVRFIGPNPQDTGTCQTSPCISAITLVPKPGTN